MDNKDQAKMTALDGMNDFVNVPATNTILTGNVPMDTELTAYGILYPDAKKKAAAAGLDNTGFSEQKLLAKEEMSKKASTLSGFALLKFENDGHLDLAGQLHISITDYFYESDANAAKTALAAYELMNTNIALLTGYVTAGDLTALKALIDGFTETVGSSDVAHEVSPVATAAFKTALNKAVKQMNRLLIPAKFMVGTADEELYKDMVELAKIPTVNVHHTSVSVSPFDNATKAAIGNASATLSTSKKPFISDLKSTLHLDRARSGQAMLTVKAAGYTDVNMVVNLQRGHDNHFDVGM